MLAKILTNSHLDAVFLWKWPKAVLAFFNNALRCSNVKQLRFAGCICGLLRLPGVRQIISL